MYLKFGFAGKSVISKAIGVSLAVMLSLSLVNVPAAKAEQSDEMREFLKKQKLKRKGLLGTYVIQTTTLRRKLLERRRQKRKFSRVRS